MFVLVLIAWLLLPLIWVFVILAQIGTTIAAPMKTPIKSAIAMNGVTKKSQNIKIPARIANKIQNVFLLFSFENIAANGFNTKRDMWIETKASIRKAKPTEKSLLPPLAKTSVGINNKDIIDSIFFICKYIIYNCTSILK